MTSFEEHVIAAGLEASLPDLLALRERSIGLRTRSPSAVALGGTRIGGCPDLPRGVPWPEREGKPMAFLAQLALEDLARHEAAKQLPPSGWLCFFHDTADTCGSVPEDAGGCAVLHFEGAADALERREIPPGVEDYQHYPECGVEIVADETLPDPLSPAGEWLTGQLPRGNDAYSALRLALAGGHVEFVHRILGWPDQIQADDMGRTCQLVTHGISYHDTSEISRVELETIESGIADWVLLFQLDSDDHTGMEFVDMGRVHFFIRKQDLAGRRFDRVWQLVTFS